MTKLEELEFLTKIKKDIEKDIVDLRTIVQNDMESMGITKMESSGLTVRLQTTKRNKLNRAKVKSMLGERDYMRWITQSKTTSLVVNMKNRIDV